MTSFECKHCSGRPSCCTAKSLESRAQCVNQPLCLHPRTRTIPTYETSLNVCRGNDFSGSGQSLYFAGLQADITISFYDPNSLHEYELMLKVSIWLLDSGSTLLFNSVAQHCLILLQFSSSSIHLFNVMDNVVTLTICLLAGDIILITSTAMSD